MAEVGFTEPFADVPAGDPSEEVHATLTDAFGCAPTELMAWFSFDVREHEDPRDRVQVHVLPLPLGRALRMRGRLQGTHDLPSDYLPVFFDDASKAILATVDRSRETVDMSVFYFDDPAPPSRRATSLAQFVHAMATEIRVNRLYNAELKRWQPNLPIDMDAAWAAG